MDGVLVTDALGRPAEGVTAVQHKTNCDVIPESQATIRCAVRFAKAFIQLGRIT